MLQPEEVDEGYFTPIGSTTLASIFRENNSKNEETVNTTLKYKPPQPNKSDQNLKSDDPNATQLVYSCSLVAYEWVNGIHKNKIKVGFAIIRTLHSGQCKIILYTSDKSRLSCTSVSAHLEITLKGNIISLYDDNKKYWGLCFNDQTINEVINHLRNENVAINHYENVQSPLFNNDALKQQVENIDSEDTSDEIDKSSTVEDIVSTSTNEKASILSRIANVGHAILPSTPSIPTSPAKKSNMVNKFNPKDQASSLERLNMPSDASHNLNAVADDSPSSTIAMQAKSNHAGNDILFNNYKQSDISNSTSVPLVNNQVFTYVNGCMVPVHVPVVSNPECGITSADIEALVRKLTYLQGYVRNMEIMKASTNSQTTNEKCSCKNPVNDNISSMLNIQSEEILKEITELKELIKEKNEIISKLHNEINNDRQQSMEKKSNTIPQSETNDLIASTIKKLMNDTYLHLANIFDEDSSYSGRNIKGIIATSIKKFTRETLSALPNVDSTD